MKDKMMSEEEYLANYDDSRYPKPSVTADIVILAGNEILLIKRGNHPFMGKWATPGGFANKLTGEGLYDAFKTAANAKRAIVEGRSFSETNKEEFRKMEHQKKVYEFFFSPIGWRLLRWALRCPRIIKWLFDAKMKRETFRA